ncbi:hypothetical protein GCM10010271_68860 [Streptomyces kurssanovii]|nr:hypothetical protein GCM10010271_68860 [Streptomyces kurssanovii]
MTGVPARHALVIGSQCRAMGTLSRLEQAAEELHAVLTDPAIGGCLARSGPYPSLLVGIDLEPEDVVKSLREATRQAKADSAVLVVALLGHGFTTQQQTDLYYMVHDSTVDSTLSAVEVGPLLAAMADEAGVDGVIALVDTCRATGAVPDASRLAGGVRSGRARLAVLTAAAADEEAHDMRLTFALVQVLKEGLSKAGDAVYVDPILIEELRKKISGQTIGRSDYDNDPFPLEGMWLARNLRRAEGADDDVVGPLGRQELRQAVEMWRAQRQLPERLTRPALDELYDFVNTGQADDETRRVWRERVRGVVAALKECARIAEILGQLLADVMTSDLLRAAGRLAGFPPQAAGAAPLRNLLEHAALRAQSIGRPPWQGLARFLAALVHQADLDSEGTTRLREWAQQHQVVAEFNDALEEFAEERQRRGVRLVVSLAGAWTGWPEEVDAWLLRPGTALPAQQRFTCESADRSGAGKAIGEALKWARSRLPSPELLENVDVAAPAHLLAQWQPEEERVGRYFLGTQHAVLVRWSGRMDLAEDNAEINDVARRNLRAMAFRAVPVDWVDPSVLGDRTRLERGLMAGRYDTAVGVDHYPEDLCDVLETLLPYAPIVLWPRVDARPASGRLRELVEQRWHELPNGFTDAYRARWDAHEDCPLCLGDIRAVWHDEAWLDFCRPFENRTVAAPEEDL